MFRAGLYARVSTNDQQTLPMQSRAMREYAARRGWTIAVQVREVGSGAAKREAREKLLEAARRREIDVVLVWRLDRWGRSVTDLLATLQELEHLGVGFVSLTEALDLTTPAGRAMAGLLAIFAEFEREILRERTRAGLAHARQNGKRLGRPETAVAHAAEIGKLYRAGVSKSEIARRLQIGRTSVRRILAAKVMKRPNHEKIPMREDRIHNEAIVDASGPEEQAMSWYYYLERQDPFPVPGEVWGWTGRRLRSGKEKPWRSCAWRRTTPASMTCSSWSEAGSNHGRPARSTARLSIQTNQPLKPSVTGITWVAQGYCL